MFRICINAFSMNAVISINERAWTGHATFELRYDQIHQMKTTMIVLSFWKDFFPLWMTSKTNRSSIDVCPRCFSLYSSKLSCVLYCVYYVAPKDIAFMPAAKIYIPSTINTNYFCKGFFLTNIIFINERLEFLTG